MFKWIALGCGLVVSAVLLWMVNDIRTKTTHSLETANQAVVTANQALNIVNRDLPEIASKTKATAETSAAVAGDVKALRELAGISSGAANDSFVQYAKQIFFVIEKEAKGGKISIGQPGNKPGLTSGLAKTLADKAGVPSVITDSVMGQSKEMPVEEWLVGARKHSIWLVLSCNSREQVLKGITNSMLGTPYFLELDGTKAVPLEDWVKERLKETK
jgi:hypothetical protein